MEPGDTKLLIPATVGVEEVKEIALNVTRYLFTKTFSALLLSTVGMENLVD